MAKERPHPTWHYALLVLSVFWMSGVGFGTWRTFPENELPSMCDLPANERPEQFDCSWLQRVKDELVYRDKQQRAAIQSGILRALVPIWSPCCLLPR